MLPCEIPNELLILSNDKIVMLYQNFINLKDDYRKLLQSEQITLDFLKNIYCMTNTIIHQTNYNELYKKYLAWRIQIKNEKINIYKNLNFYKKMKYVILNDIEITRINEFLYDLIALYELMQSIEKNNNPPLEFFVPYLNNVIELLCYKNSIVRNYLVTNCIIPLTISSIIKYLAPVEPCSLFLDFIEYGSFIKDSFLPYECYKDPEENIYILCAINNLINK